MILPLGWFDTNIECAVVCIQTASAEYQSVSDDLRKNPYNNILQYNGLPGNCFYKDADHKVVNPYQKPLGLYLQLVKMYCMPDAVVVDLTFGSGSLELAAMEVGAPKGLRFIAFEKNEYQATHGINRIKAACVPPTDDSTVQPDASSEQAVVAGNREDDDED